MSSSRGKVGTYDRNVPNFHQPQQLEVSVGGDRLALFTLAASVPQELTQPEERRRIDRATLDEEWVVRFQAAAGPHEVMATFINRTPALLETLIESYQRPHPSGGHNWGSRRGVYLRSVEISGPFPVGETRAGSSASVATPGDEAAGTARMTRSNDTPSRRRILVCRPADPSQEAGCADTILSGLARRAYRRPVTDADVAGLLRFYEEGRTDGGFESGIEMAVRRLLVSPEFLFRTESDPANIAPGTNYRISDLELASRLSFFLWSSIPDDDDDLEAAELLIRAGANVRATNRYGVAPLALACLNGERGDGRDAVGRRRGLQRDAAGRRDRADDRVAHGAGGGGAGAAGPRRGPERARALERADGADVGRGREQRRGPSRAGRGRRRSPRSLEHESRPDPQRTGDKAFTALLFAARAGRIEAARALLEAGGDVNDTLSDGTSALVLATLSAQYDMGVFLLEQGADPNAAEQGWTALHQVAWTRRPSRGPTTVGPVARGAVDSLKLATALITHGADPNSRITKEASEIYVGRNQMNRLGATPFFMAASRVDVEYMRLLARGGADPFLPNDEGTTPLMAAAGVGLWFPGESPGTPEEAAAAVEFCLELGGDATTVDANGDTALHGAAYWDSPRALELLVAVGARLDVENGKGWTPLRIAVGVAITASIHISADAADTLRRMRAERGLPVPDPIIGVAK